MTPQIAKKIDFFFAGYRLQTFDKNHVLIHAGDEPSGIFHLITGQVRQYDITEQGDKMVVNVFRPPAFFPMSWAINKTPNQYFYETANQVTLRQAPPKAVVKFLKTNPDVTYDLLNRVYLGTDVLLRRMVYLMGGSAKTRILFELLLEGRRFGERQTDGTYVIDMHEYELAARSGLSRETISREVGKIRNLGIEVRRNGIVVKDLKRLEKELSSDL